jgi:hypothetical protein
MGYILHTAVYKLFLHSLSLLLTEQTGFITKQEQRGFLSHHMSLQPGSQQGKSGIRPHSICLRSWP